MLDNKTRKEFLSEFLEWIACGDSYSMCVEQLVDNNCLECETHKHIHRHDFYDSDSKKRYEPVSDMECETLIDEYLMCEHNDIEALERLQGRGIFMNYYVDQDNKVKMRTHEEMKEYLAQKNKRRL